MLLILVFSLLVLTILEYNILKGDISSPSLIYNIGFLICSIVAFSYRKEWSLEYDDFLFSTYLLILSGSAIFFIIELFCRSKYPIKKIHVGERINYMLDSINSKLLLFFCFQLFSYFIMAKAQMAYTGMDLASSVADISGASKSDGVIIRMPVYVRVLNAICQKSCFIWSCLLAYSCIHKSKMSTAVLLGLNFLIALVGSSLGGGRMTMLAMFIPFIIVLFIFYKSKHSWNIKHIPIKYQLLAVSVAVGFSLSFSYLGTLIGRGESSNAASYVFAVYCGAEIKNLNTFMESPKMINTTGLCAENTLNVFYTELFRNFAGYNTSAIENRLDFQATNSYNLGNVYTNYYLHYLDFGWFGLIFICIMAYFIYMLYRPLFRKEFLLTGIPNLRILLFCSLIGYVFLCFFSNVFYEHLSIMQIINSLIYWKLILLFIFGRNYERKIKNFCSLP